MRRTPVFGDPKTEFVFQPIFGSDDHKTALKSIHAPILLCGTRNLPSSHPLSETLTMISRINKAVLSLGLTLSLGFAFTPLGCGAASEAPSFVPSRARPMRPDRAMAARIGRQALEEYGYEEIIRRAVEAHFLRYPDPAKPNAGNLVGQTLEEAAKQAWPVFTQWAVAAGITSQLDSPAPGPADVVALGEIVVGLIHAGAIATMVLTMSSDNAGSTTTTTAIPIVRRYPNQTCDDKELDALEAEKKMLCYSGYAADCGDPNKKKFMRTPCSAIILSLQQRLACLQARNLVQKKCFGGVPDPGHKMAIDEVQNGINNCEALKLVNCTKGHPMAGL